MTLYRARMTLLLAIGLASALLVFELPLPLLLHQRAALAATAGQLQMVEARNATIVRDIALLRGPAAVAAIAHGEYGLVQHGQLAYAVVGPSASATGGASSSLRDRAVPSADLVVPSADALGAASSAAASTGVEGASITGSIWSRFLDRLAFWRWAF